MQGLQHSPVQLIHRLVARVRRWREARRNAHPPLTSLFLNSHAYAPTIHRDVTSTGVHVYSLCGDCGARLRASATLCDECAQKRSRPARPL
jgi:ribosomal protein L40E